MAVAGIDPHRESFTIAVVNEVGVPLETVSWPATPTGFESGAEFLTAHGVSVVGVEGSGSNGRHVAAALMVAGFDVREVPPRRSVQWRGGERRSKTDRIDALSVARVTGSDPDLGPAKVVLDAAFAELEVVRSRRVSVIDHLKRTLADADRQLAELPPALTTEVGSKGDTRTRLRRLLATGPVSDDRAVAARLGWLGELSDEIRQLDSKARALANQMGALLEEHGSTLTDIYGLGPVSATEIVLRVGDPTRFETEVRLRPMERHRTGRGVLGRGRRTPAPSPPRPRRLPGGEQLAAHRVDHPIRPRPPRQSIPRPQTSRRQDRPRGTPIPQAPPLRRRHPPHVGRPQDHHRDHPHHPDHHRTHSSAHRRLTKKHPVALCATGGTAVAGAPKALPASLCHVVGVDPVQWVLSAADDSETGRAGRRASDGDRGTRGDAG